MASPAAAQEPWEEWIGPIGDGIMDFRFGMDRQTAREMAQRRKVKAVHSRRGTSRYEGNFLSMDGELLLEFAPDPRWGGGEVLTRIRLDWVGIPGGGGRPQAMFESLDQLLQKRYGPAIFRRDASISEISSGFRDGLHVYKGPEMQAQLSLRSAGGESIRLMLVLICPQLDSAFER